MNASVDVTALHARLQGAITGEVRFDALSRALYSTDASIYQIMPLGVVVPKTEADVVATLRIGEEFRVPLTVRGAGTSQAGQAVGSGLQLDCSKFLNEILEINAAERWARVQPGCVLDDLNLRLQPFGLQFAPDVSTSNRATIGGMIGNNSCGSHSILYGKTVDHVLELKVVMSDGAAEWLGPLTSQELEKHCAHPGPRGARYNIVRHLASKHADEIRNRYPRVLRRVGGYNLDLFLPAEQVDKTPRPALVRAEPALFNLARLFVGSEGTLGLTLEAKLRLVELPRARALAVVQFADLLDALAATPAILQHQPAAVEVLDKYVLDCTRLNAQAARLRDIIHGDPGAILLIEFFGRDQDEARTRLQSLVKELSDRAIGYHHVIVVDPTSQQRVWKLRREALGLSMAQTGDAKSISFVEDTAVVPERLRDYIEEFLAIISRCRTHAGVYAHASVGCLHVRPVINLKTAEGIRQFEQIADDVADLVLKFGGALSGEHGDGLVRSPFQERMFGPVLYNAFRELKRTFDPHNLLNPGKIVDAPPLTANLRYGPAYTTPDPATTFDYSLDGGLTRAAERCVGIGACRKNGDGVMCPSYQATRDEQHSTRGRANALRLALTGQLGRDGLTDRTLFDVFDLCLECKACKTECPTNVDMARAKAEFLAQYYRKHALPFRNRLFGNIVGLSRWGCAFAPLSNWWLRSRSARWLGDTFLGIDRRRVPPAFARQSLTRRFRHALTPAPSNTPRIILFPDTFTNYYEPDVGAAAFAILGRLSSAVSFGLPPSRGTAGLRCCGRPMISNGMLDEAVRCARHNIAALYPRVLEGAVITACEPSCILTIKDDYPALLRGEARLRAERVAAACQTFEDCCESRIARPAGPNGARADFRFHSSPRRILVHGHCHQRALTGLNSTLDLLRRIPQAEVSMLDAGCCGMAGSFGYEKEHYEISRLVGEQRLFPQLRREMPQSIVIASGFSCRRQIEHFTGRRAVHAATFLAGLIA